MIRKLLLKISMIFMMLGVMNTSLKAQVNITFPEVLFTDASLIAREGTSTVILDRLIALIDNTPAGENIRISIYLINYQPVMDALKNAETRGVNIKMLVDMSRSDSQETNAASLPWLQANLAGSEIVSTVNDVSSLSINHHKYVLFSKVNTTAGLVSNITLQTSHNFTLSDAKKVQDAITFNDAGIYNAFLNNWQMMRSYAAAGMKNNFNYTVYEDVTNGLRAEFFPKITNGSFIGQDNVIENLNAITDVANAKIRIAMSDWSDLRVAIADKLIALKNQGATIEVYAKDAAGTLVQTKLRQLQQLGATVRIFNLESGSDAKFNIHAKIMLIEGTWKGQANSKVIITGSHNYTDPALKANNEVLVYLLNSPLFNQYHNYFEGLKTVVPTVQLLAWDLTGLTSSDQSDYPATYLSGMLGSKIARGSGLVYNVLTKGFSSAKADLGSGVLTTTFTEAKDRNEYYEFSVKPLPGKAISLSEISAKIRRTSNGSSKIQWTYILNGGAITNIGSEIGVNSTTEGYYLAPVNVSNIIDLQDIRPDELVKIRLYVYGEGTRTGTIAFGVSSATDVNVLTIRGDLANISDDNLLISWSANTLSGATASFTSTTRSNAISSSTMIRGGGLEASSLSKGFSSRTNASLNFTIVTDKTSAIANNSYVEFDVNVLANYKVSIKTIYAKLRRSSAGARNYIIQYSINGGTFLDASPALSFSNSFAGGIPQDPIDVSGVTALQNIEGSKNIKFRIYSWGYTSTVGSFAFGLSETSSDDVFTIAGTAVSTSLPVVLNKFEAVKQVTQVGLNWSTSSEKNNSHFEILRSSDAKNWTLLSTIQGQGTKDELSTYSYADVNPEIGNNYYQLKQIDFNGDIALSEIKVVNYGLLTNELKAYADDAQVIAFISQQQVDEGYLNIFDISGRKLLSEKVRLAFGLNKVALPIRLAKGVYVLRLDKAQEKLTTKFIK
ncbi:T9SS type A sorting domain-containing protein [Pedobacter aquae]|uniref:phospholipase D n=1 Tax=Pedobacter aquae TaxID=2605747 RepID=A0A5C0VJM5_9SPHI|nr:phospholipase D-like domain-containing protein [Pedobacter aquae]QEK52289.1 T9SS type A sorting domain-containing protein [Pedobacter aquae]